MQKFDNLLSFVIRDINSFYALKYSKIFPINSGQNKNKYFLIELSKVLKRTFIRFHYDNFKADFLLQIAAENGHLEVVKYLVQNIADNETIKNFVLCRASYFGKLDIVKYLISQKADIHSDEDCALMLA